MSSEGKTVFLPAMDVPLFQKYKQLIYDRTRIVLTENKRSMISTRILKRLNIAKKYSFNEYYDFINTHAGQEELLLFINAITTNHTFFFREFSHFDFLRNHILPEWVEKHGAPKPFRVWSSASSTGEEAYSVGMVIDNWKQQTNNIFDWSVLGSDISSEVIDTAQKGIYPYESANGLPEGFLENYFQRGKESQQGLIRIKPSLREHTKFSQLNLFSNSYPFTEKFPVIFCRNAMIYFDEKNQADLVKRLIEHLEHGGYLIIGHSESIKDKTLPLKYLKPAIFQKI